MGRLLRWLLWYPLLLALVALILVQIWFVVHIGYWATHNPETTAFMQARLGKMREQDPHAELRHQWVPYERISVQLKRAVVAAEDAKFLDHEGFDWEAIQNAYDRNQKKGKVVY